MDLLLSVNAIYIICSLYISVNQPAANTQSVCFFGGKFISVVSFDTETGR